MTITLICRTNQPSPVWWYTRDTFLYQILNRALRTQDIELIMKMAFFVRDLHEHIKKLHSDFDKEEIFTVYRGQGMLPEDIQRLEKSKGGLLSFNNFLSTSEDPDVSRSFVQRALENPDHVAVQFLMKINPKKTTTVFARLGNESYFDKNEQEILFSMHTVFRIDDVHKKKDRLWEVHLTLTNEYDQQLDELANHFRKDIKGKTAQHRLACLLSIMGEYDKSLHVYETLLQQMTDKNDWKELSFLHHQSGYNYKQKGNLTKALSEYQQCLDIELKHYPSDDPHLTPSYSNIGEVYRLKRDFTVALTYFQRALKIEQQSKNADQLKIASYYNNIGTVYNDQDEYEKALENFENALQIKQKNLPPCHPSLATAYDNIGIVYLAQANFDDAYSYFQKALDVEQRVLPSTHKSLAVTHNHMAIVLSCLNRHSEALIHAKKALDIASYTYEPTHSQYQIYEEHVKGISEKC